MIWFPKTRQCPSLGMQRAARCPQAFPTHDPTATRTHSKPHPAPSFLILQPANHPYPTQETTKKRTRRTVKQQRGIVGAPLELIKDRRSQRPEAREAARKEAIAKGKEKKATAESKKKAEKAKSAAGAARGQPGRIQSKMGSKGVPSKASGKTR